LVAANGWIEGLTVGSIILGTVLGGVLISNKLSAVLLGFDLPMIETGIDTSPEAAICVIAVIYLIAAGFNLRIPDTGAIYPKQESNPIRLIRDFKHCFHTLWKDRLGQISLAVTTLFWGAGATLQFIVLKWAESALGMSLSQGAILQAVVAFGVAGGAIYAAARIPLNKALGVLKYGVMMGVLVMIMAIYRKDLLPDVSIDLGLFSIPLYLFITYIFLITIGWMSGYFVVPMNALLQHRGHVLLSAGHSIAVQNFNENLSVLAMLCLYALLIWLDVPIYIVILLFGSFVCLIMILIMRWHSRNQAEYDSLHLIGEHKH
jgi:hypothetical protein